MNTKEFIQYASERPELCEKMSACTTPEEVYTIAKEAGLTDDSATFTEVMTAAKAEAEKLSDKDLAQVNAAGSGTILSATLSTASVVSFSAVAAAV